MDQLKNLFEITKTIKFELKPTKLTHSRIQDWFTDTKKISDPYKQFEYAKGIANRQEKIISRLQKREE